MLRSLALTDPCFLIGCGYVFFLMIRRPPRSTRTTHSFPTRRSSDLQAGQLFRQPFAHIAGRIVGQQQMGLGRSEEHTSELQSLMRISYAVFCLKKKTE